MPLSGKILTPVQVPLNYPYGKNCNPIGPIGNFSGAHHAPTRVRQEGHRLLFEIVSTRTGSALLPTSKFHLQ